MLNQSLLTELSNSVSEWYKRVRVDDGPKTDIESLSPVLLTPLSFPKEGKIRVPVAMLSGKLCRTLKEVKDRSLQMEIYPNNLIQTRLLHKVVEQYWVLKRTHRELFKHNFGPCTYYFGKGLLLDENFDTLLVATIDCEQSKKKVNGEFIPQLKCSNPIIYYNPIVFHSTIDRYKTAKKIIENLMAVSYLNVKYRSCMDGLTTYVTTTSTDPIYLGVSLRPLTHQKDFITIIKPPKLGTENPVENLPILTPGEISMLDG